MAHAIATAVECAHIICRGTWLSCASTSELRLCGCRNLLLLLSACILRLCSSCELRLLRCLRHMLLTCLLWRHARMSHCSWVYTTWVWTMAGRAIRNRWLWGLGNRLVLYRCTTWWWEMLLLRVVWWRRILGLPAAGGRGVMLLLLGRGRRGRRWVGLAARRRREVLLLTLWWLICRVSDLRVESGVRSGQELTYHNHLSQAELSPISIFSCTFVSCDSRG
jgi:hypothetical protein